MSKPIVFIVSFLLLQHAALCAQQKSILSPESLKMHIVYQLGFIPIPVGELVFKTYNSTYANKAALCLVLSGYNLHSYDKIYSYKSNQQSFIDPKNHCLYGFERNVDQNGDKLSEKYSIDLANKSILSVIKKGSGNCISDTLKTEVFVNDFLSASYFIRQFDFSKFKIGQKTPITLLLDNKTYLLYIRYLGVEKIKLPNGAAYNCNKIVLQTIPGSVFRGGEAITAWISDNKAHTPIQFEAHILIGKVKAYLIN